MAAFFWALRFLRRAGLCVPTPRDAALCSNP